VTATTALFAVLALWLLIGVGCSFVMARRGHDPWSWGALGALFGPLIVPVALSVSRRDRVLATDVRITHTGVPGPGDVSVLVGVDGSADAEDAACDTVRLFGDRLGRVVIATVLDYDAAATEHHTEAGIYMVEAKRVLDDVAEVFTGLDPDRVVLTGRPADALLAYAREHDVDLVVVGARGRGLSKSVLGSVVERVVRQPDIPVLVGGVPDASGRLGGGRVAVRSSATAEDTADASFAGPNAAARRVRTIVSSRRLSAPEPHGSDRSGDTEDTHDGSDVGCAHNDPRRAGRTDRQRRKAGGVARA